MQRLSCQHAQRRGQVKGVCTGIPLLVPTRRFTSQPVGENSSRLFLLSATPIPTSLPQHLFGISVPYFYTGIMFSFFLEGFLLYT